MARHLTPEEIAVFKHEFDQYDIDGGGSISVEEFGRVMASSSGQKPSDEEIAKIIREVDLDGDGTISFNEFITMMTGHPYPPPPAAPSNTTTTKATPPVPEALQPGRAPPPAVATTKPELELDSEADLRKAWSEFDPSCASSITTAQFRQVINELGESVSDAEIEGIMDDINGDEKISYRQFIQFMKRKDGEVNDIVNGYGS